MTATWRAAGVERADFAATRVVALGMIAVAGRRSAALALKECESMASFEARTSAHPGRSVVALVGECDLAVRDELTSALIQAVESAPVVEVDLDALQFIDSTGVHALVTAHHAAQRGGTALYVTNARGPVAHVLDITGVGALLRAPNHGG